MRTNLLSEASKAWIYTPADAGQDIEVIHWQYYYYQTVLGDQNNTVNIADMSFFNATAGQPTSTGTLTKEDTNIPKPNAVGSPYKFLIQEVAFAAMPAIPQAGSLPAVGKDFRDDIAQILSRGFVSLSVLGVSRMEVSPLMALPSGMGFTMSDTRNPYAIENGWSVLSNRYPVEIGLHKDTSFELNVSFPKGVFRVYNPIKLGFILDGLLQRPKGK